MDNIGQSGHPSLLICYWPKNRQTIKLHKTNKLCINFCLTVFSILNGKKKMLFQCPYNSVPVLLQMCDFQMEHPPGRTWRVLFVLFIYLFLIPSRDNVWRVTKYYNAQCLHARSFSAPMVRDKVQWFQSTNATFKQVYICLYMQTECHEHGCHSFLSISTDESVLLPVHRKKVHGDSGVDSTLLLRDAVKCCLNY